MSELPSYSTPKSAAAQSGATPSTPWGGYTIALMGIILLLRVVSLYFNTTDLFFDEAQYWLWGKEPAFGYFSKPPVLAWIIGTVTTICGSDSEFCVRLASPLIHTGTAFFIYLAAARLFDRRTGFFSALTYATLPGITLSSTLISTDVPLLFFWAGSLWAYLRLRDNPSWGNAILLGLLIGAGLMSKYAMAYFFLCAVLLAIFDKSERRTVFSAKFLGASVIALVVLLPNLWWNAQNSFITAAHTAENIDWRGQGLQYLNAAEFFGSQFGVFGPILFAFFLIALVRFWREGWDKAQKFLVLFSLPVLVLITFQGLMSKAYANWAAVTYIAATILIADIMVNRVPPLWNRLSLSIHTVIFAVLSIAVAFSAPGILKLPDGREPFERLQGWRDIARAVEVQLDKSTYSAVIGPNRKITAELVYYLRQRPQKIFAWRQSTTPRDHYQLTRSYRGEPAGAVLLVQPSRDADQYRAYFDNVYLVGQAEFSSGSVRKLWFFQLEGYQGVRQSERNSK